MRREQVTALMYGWIVVLGLILLSSFILALFLRFSSFNDPTLSWVSLAIGLIALFLGGLVAGLKGKTKGWMIGAIVGLGFTLFTFLIQYLGYQKSFDLEQSTYHLFYILAAILGGVIGVNLSSNQS